jgi:bile acid:Na+ symporter, BASS family
LVIDDFKRILVYPKAVALGLTNQLIFLPLIGFALCLVFDLSPVMAVGVMLIAACPGGATSNLITHVSRGDTALSITLTAFSGVITIITIPLILVFAIGYFEPTAGVDAEAVEAPIGAIVAQLVAITAVPVTLGMLIRKFKPAFADRMDKPARLGSALIFIFVLAVVIVDSWDVLQEHFIALSGVTGALNLITMALGFATARALSLEMRRAVTIAIESGIQNGTLAIVVATSILKLGDAAVPGGVYSLIMFMSGGLLMLYFGLLTAPREER